MTLKVTVLGCSSGGVPHAGGAGSGYLVQAGDTTVLVDCGNGVLGNLKRHVDYDDVDAVYVTHAHADHCTDLITLALQFRFRRKGRVPLFGPEGIRTMLYRWFSLFHAHPDPYVEAFHVQELKPWEARTVGDVRFQACPVEHNVPTFGFRAEPAGGGKRFFFSGDSRAGGLVTEAAMDADLFLADATYQDLEEGKEPEKSREHHMTAREAASVAARANAKRLVLTHLLYTADPAVSVAQAREAFDGPVDAARVGDVFEV